LDVTDGVSVGCDGEHNVGIHLWIVTIFVVCNLDADDLIELSKNNDPEKEEEGERHDIEEYIQQKINQLAEGVKDCHIRHEFENAHRNEDYIEHQNHGEAIQRYTVVKVRTLLPIAGQNNRGMLRSDTEVHNIYNKHDQIKQILLLRSPPVLLPADQVHLQEL